MNIRKLLIKLIIITGLGMVLALSGCSFSASTGALVAPAIKVVGPLDSGDAGSLTLKITGPDMDPVEVTYTELPETINIAIPEGADRTFELTGTTGSSYTGPIASFSGSATADITQDSAEITLTIGIESTKIIVPDTYNGRLVQINNMNGDGWTTLEESAITTIGTFQPVDVDFDEYGNIYVANNVSGSDSGIWKFTSINDTTPVKILSSPILEDYPPSVAVAVDRINKRVYSVWSTGSVYYNDYLGSLGSGIQYLINSDFSNGIYDICVENGYLYVSGWGSNSEMMIEKYGSSGDTAISFYSGGVFDEPSGMVFYGGALYVSVGGGYSSPVARIEKFDLDLNHVTGTFSLGTYADDPTGVNQFAGPGKFLATLNDTLTVMDANNVQTNISRLVSFDNIAGDGWKVFGTYGFSGGVNQFAFVQPPI